ncbi:hypothetical protein B0T10DRAFT_140134 [Thelonectria olida]|uniref:Uncharacterized protein n=1 Tax=Thelonectria olida TaxID=1576542 RepID=A0A9P8VX35_9HYPO|nr:hypothetical protein B0T10DRAFT_140134 [Thelonectria olida]
MPPATNNAPTHQHQQPPLPNPHLQGQLVTHPEKISVSSSDCDTEGVGCAKAYEMLMRFATSEEKIDDVAEALAVSPKKQVFQHNSPRGPIDPVYKKPTYFHSLLRRIKSFYPP